MSKLITDPEKIRLQEETDVQAILGRPPSWLIRWGISLVFVAVVLLLVLGKLFRYPDIIEAPAIIQKAAPPVRLEAKTDGRIEKLWVANEAPVDSGDLLVTLQNPVPYRDFQELQTTLDSLMPALQNRNILDIQLPQRLQLAQLQTYYGQLDALLESQQYLLEKDDAQQRIRILRQKLEQVEALSVVTDTVIHTLGQVVAIARSNRDKYAELLGKGMASQLEFEEAETSYLRSRRELEDRESAYINHRLEIQELRNQILALQQDQSNEIKNGWVQLNEAARQLVGAVEEWEDRFLIKAPAYGKVILSSFWTENQFVRQGATVLTINPDNAQSEIIARGTLPLASSGKVQKGQTVLLRLQAYPYKEFGVLEGRVEHVSPIPDVSETPVYHLLIHLASDSLITTAEKAIPFTPEMHATARIITADRSFLSRVMDEVVSIFRRD